MFVNFLLADEINRAPAKVQSALLEVMAEQQVTIGGQTHQVPRPFFVVATQNPIESEGVYQLPDAQRDRFMMKVILDHPTPAEEMVILDRMAVQAPVPDRVIDLAGLVALQRRCDQVFVDRTVGQYAVDLVHATRQPANYHLADLAPLIALGVSPRATLGADPRRPGAGADPRAHLHHTPGRLRHRPRGAPPPAAADLRRPRPRHRHRRADQPHPRHRAGDVGVAEAQRVDPPDAVTACNARPPVRWPDGPPPAAVVELVRSLEITIGRRVDTTLHGNYQGITPGHGSEPGESRPYQPGDDVRRIDWNVTARTGETHVRDQIADRDLEAWLVVDVSAAMRFGTATAGEGPGRPRRRGVRRVPHRAQQEPHRCRPRRRAAHQADAAALRARPGAGDPHLDRLTTALGAPRAQRSRRGDRPCRPAQPAAGLRLRHRRLRRRGLGRPAGPPGHAQRPAGDPDPRSPRARRAADRSGVARRRGDRRAARGPRHQQHCSDATPRRPRRGSSNSVDDLRRAGADVIELRTDSDWLGEIIQHVRRRKVQAVNAQVIRR